MKVKTAWIALALAPALALLGVPATATTYNLQTGCSANFKTSLVAGASNATTTCSGGGASPITGIQAVSNTGVNNVSTSTVTGALQAAYIGVYGTHLGVTSTAGTVTAGGTSYDGTLGALGSLSVLDTTSSIVTESTGQPEHAMDNHNNVEGMLISFSTAVSLTQIQLGYYDTDSDITLYAYTGSQLPVANGLLSGSDTWTSLTSQGWTKIKDYADVAGTGGSNVNGTFSQAVSTTTLSSYWLIAAYTGITGTGTGTGGNGISTSLTAGNDFVKLLTVTACTGAAGCGFNQGSTPEPSTVLLMGAALLALRQMHRRRTA